MCEEAPGVATLHRVSCWIFSSIVKTDHDDPLALLDGSAMSKGFRKRCYRALVAFGEAVSMHLICPGTCKEATIHNVGLDWDIDLTVSATDNADKTITTKNDPNKLIVRQENSFWNDTEKDTQAHPPTYNSNALPTLPLCL